MRALSNTLTLNISLDLTPKRNESSKDIPHLTELEGKNLNYGASQLHERKVVRKNVTRVKTKKKVGIISIFNVLETNNIHTTIYKRKKWKPHNNN